MKYVSSSQKVARIMTKNLIAKDLLKIFMIYVRKYNELIKEEFGLDETELMPLWKQVTETEKDEGPPPPRPPRRRCEPASSVSIDGGSNPGVLIAGGETPRRFANGFSVIIALYFSRDASSAKIRWAVTISLTSCCARFARGPVTVRR